MFTLFGAIFGLLGFLTFGALAIAGMTLFFVLLIPLLIFGLFFRIGFVLVKLAAVCLLAVLLIGAFV